MINAFLQKSRRRGEFQPFAKRKIFEPRSPFGQQRLRLPAYLISPRRLSFFSFSSLKKLIDDKVGNFINRIGRITELTLNVENREVAL